MSQWVKTLYNGGMTPITWTLKTYPIDSLTEYAKNPRSLSQDQFTHLKKSIDKFGLIDKPIINLDLTVIGGHQRLHVLKAEGVKECECWIPSRLLTEREVEELNIRLNKNTGAWDFDVLANEWAVPDLLEWGFSEIELGLKTPEDWAGAMSGLPDQDRAPFQQMTFTLHDTQAETVKEALKAAQAMGAFIDSENENSNGNALARICEMFIGENERS